PCAWAMSQAPSPSPSNRAKRTAAPTSCAGRKSTRSRRSCCSSNDRWSFIGSSSGCPISSGKLRHSRWITWFPASCSRSTTSAPCRYRAFARRTDLPLSGSKLARWRRSCRRTCLQKATRASWIVYVRLLGVERLVEPGLKKHPTLSRRQLGKLRRLRVKRLQSQVLQLPAQAGHPAPVRSDRGQMRVIHRPGEPGIVIADSAPALLHDEIILPHSLVRTRLGFPLDVVGIVA